MTLILLQRIEPYGWDADDRTYYVLDDNRVYRLSAPPATPASKPKSKPKKTYGSSRRSSKRRRATTDTADEPETKDDNNTEYNDHGSDYGGMKWECVAVTLEDVRLLINSMRKTRDGNERVLRDQLEVHLLPILEKQEESRRRKQEKHDREMLSLAKMANAKRSTRIAHKVEQQKQDEKDKEEQDKLMREAEEERRAEQKRQKLERERDFRMFSREKRLKEREARRRLHQEELSQLSEDSKAGPDGAARVSERRLQLEIDRNRQALQDLEDEEEDWIFDCICGLYGQVDDGAHSIACERCNVWQHSKCVGIAESEADRPDFQFICTSCKRRIEEANTPRKTIKLKIKGPTEMAANKQRADQSPQKPVNQVQSPASTKELLQMKHQESPIQNADPGTTPSSGYHAATKAVYAANLPDLQLNPTPRLSDNIDAQGRTTGLSSAAPPTTESASSAANPHGASEGQVDAILMDPATNPDAVKGANGQGNAHLQRVPQDTADSTAPPVGTSSLTSARPILAAATTQPQHVPLDHPRALPLSTSTKEKPHGSNPRVSLAHDYRSEAMSQALGEFKEKQSSASPIANMTHPVVDFTSRQLPPLPPSQLATSMPPNHIVQPTTELTLPPISSFSNPSPVVSTAPKSHGIESGSDPLRSNENSALNGGTSSQR